MRVRLLECVRDDGVSFDETLPDGGIAESVSGRGTGGVRLHLLLENLSDERLQAAMCNEGLAVLSEYSARPLCGATGADGDWKPLPPRESIHLYPLRVAHVPTMGTVTDGLLPNVGHAPIVNWPGYVPDPVAFELTPAGCRPVDATEINDPSHGMRWSPAAL